MYNLKDNHYDTFCDLLVDIGNKINSKNIQILIRLNYFSEFGTISKLLKIYELYTNLYGKIQISKDKYPKLNNIFSKFAIKETEKRFTFNNTLPILKGIEKHLKNKENDVIQLILDYFKYTGACDIKNDSYGNNSIVIDINTKYAPKITLYSIKKGMTKEIKIYKKNYINPLKIGDVISIQDAEYRYKKKKEGNKWVNTNEKELIVNAYKILN